MTRRRFLLSLSAAVLLSLPRRVSARAGGTITILSPGRYCFYGRDSTGHADITIEGQYTGPMPATIEASWGGGSPFQAIPLDPATGAFRGTLRVGPCGAGTLVVRRAEDHAVTASVDDIAVGDVFLVPGQRHVGPMEVTWNLNQSNADGRNRAGVIWSQGEYDSGNLA